MIFLYFDIVVDFDMFAGTFIVIACGKAVSQRCKVVTITITTITTTTTTTTTIPIIITIPIR